MAASEMIERATAAFIKALPRDFYVTDGVGEGGGPAWVIDGSGDIRGAIRAALAAMREPTEAMCDAVNTGPFDWGGDTTGDPPSPELTWPLMIDVILAE